MAQQDNELEIDKVEEITEETTTQSKTVDEKQLQIDDITDRYKRLMAEFENFKKRSQKEREQLYNSVMSDVIEVMLPVVDNLENAATVNTEDTNYKQGVELVLKQFKDVLKAKGVEEIEVMGKTFDPSFHEAVSSIQDSTKGEQEIVQEYRKGYKIGGKVIRHSMVVVAN
ncbi:heat shock protein GrpE [compost metagenome]